MFLSQVLSVLAPVAAAASWPRKSSEISENAASTTFSIFFLTALFCQLIKQAVGPVEQSRAEPTDPRRRSDWKAEWESVYNTTNTCGSDAAPIRSLLL